MNAYPLAFEPVFMERVWGGRNLESLYQKPLPPDVPIGESWEISDRPEAVNVVKNGEYAGRDLRYLMDTFPDGLLGDASPASSGRFPLLVKILDAEQKLSLQVHPPANIAPSLQGEPKTEMWFITHTAPNADLFVGLNHGVTPEIFESKIRDGSVADCFHRIPVKPGDAMFLPSGRVHAIGAGNVIFEIQQNSDTTYRVFDWNRVGLDGKPRDLHIDQSLQSIDFSDFAPPLASPIKSSKPQFHGGSTIVDDPLFSIESVECIRPASHQLELGPRPVVIGVHQGSMEITGGTETLHLAPGQFSLLPAALPSIQCHIPSSANFLIASAN